MEHKWIYLTAPAEAGLLAPVYSGVEEFLYLLLHVACVEDWANGGIRTNVVVEQREFKVISFLLEHLCWPRMTIVQFSIGACNAVETCLFTAFSPKTRSFFLFFGGTLVTQRWALFPSR